MLEFPHAEIERAGDVEAAFPLAAFEREEGLPLAGEIAEPLAVVGVGAFPDLRRARVIWAGVSDPSGILKPVHARLNETLAVFGAKREKKKYQPHVTLARVRGGPFDADLLEERRGCAESGAGDIWMGTQSVDAVAIVMSEIKRGKPPRYTVMGHYGR